MMAKTVSVLRTMSDMGKQLTMKRMTITDAATEEAQVEESTTTFDNGFVGFWVPSDITGTIEITAEDKTGSTGFSTDDDGATCVTDLKLQ